VESVNPIIFIPSRALDSFSDAIFCMKYRYGMKAMTI
jgi:hypothetical protein